MEAVAAHWGRAGRDRPSQTLPNWIIAWVILPNLAFFGLWLLATPPRAFEILVTGATGIAVRRAPFWLRLSAFIATLSLSILSYISGIFNLSFVSIATSLTYLVELDALTAPAYAGAAAILLAIGAAGVVILRRDTAFHSITDLLVAVLVVAAVAGIDFGVSYQSRGSYKRTPSAGAPFASAVSESGLLRTAIDGRHVLIVAVESMGLPAEPALRRILFERWQRADIRARYDVRVGSAPYYGSTTNGEIRELCGRWGDYGPLLDHADRNCLPHRFAKRGYTTTAVHGFTHTFFERSRWYPNIGFAKTIFGEELVAAGSARCPGVFNGACDKTVPALLAGLLQSDRPQFLYWLTLNSHLPVPVSAMLDDPDCHGRQYAGVEMTNSVCRLIQVLTDTDDGLAAMLAAPGLSPTEILIVGDHMPPFFDHASRRMFDSKRVPWIRLTPRPDVARTS